MARQADGEPLKTHLLCLFQQTGVMPEQLSEAPGLPVLGKHVWDWFVELHNERSNGERLSLTDIRDWSLVTGTLIEAWELRALRRLDTIWLKAQDEYRRSDPSSGG